MSIRYENLDDEVRAQMVSEVERDIKNGCLYLSPRLTERGVTEWPGILREACETHDDRWIAEQLRSRGLLKALETRERNGKVHEARVPVTAAETLSEGEFNRFYARGLCASLEKVEGAEVEAYRGKDVANPRPESERMIGSRLSPASLLKDLRESAGVEPALGLPPGPNSGLTIRRVKSA